MKYFKSLKDEVVRINGLKYNKYKIAEMPNKWYKNDKITSWFKHGGFVYIAKTN